MVIGTYEELMLGVKGKKQKRGSRAKSSKKGGSKTVEDDIMDLGYGNHHFSYIVHTTLHQQVKMGYTGLGSADICHMSLVTHWTGMAT